MISIDSTATPTFMKIGEGRGFFCVDLTWNDLYIQ